MSAKGHSLLGASSSQRWIACPPSARLSEQIEDVTSSFAIEGSIAHLVAERALRSSLNMEFDEIIDETQVTEEMIDGANDYVSYISELLTEIKKTCSDPVVLIEQELDFSRWVPEGFGTGDALIIADDTLHVIDYKFGKGIAVNSEKNSQLSLYALGALEKFECLYDIKKVCLTIFQPRLHNVNSYETTVEELKEWAENIVKPRAKEAWEGKGTFKAGSHCRFCRLRATCRARAEANLKLAELDFQKPPILTDDEVEEVLEKVDCLVSWATEIKTYALDEALKGKKWKNWKLVEGRSNRKISDENAVVTALTGAGFDPYEKKLVSITELQKRIGKVKFAELVEPYIFKPQGKPTLTRRDDKREELNSAASDFRDLEN